MLTVYHTNMTTRLLPFFLFSFVRAHSMTGSTTCYISYF